MTAAEQRLDRLAILAGRSWHAEELSGGLTNVNYRVRTDDAASGKPALDVVVRVWQEAGSWLAIDRDNEHHNTLAAAETGVSPAVRAFDPAAGMMAVDYVPSRTLSKEDLLDLGNLRRIAASCRRLHAGRPFTLDFDMFGIQLGYLKTVQEHGFRLPERYVDLMPEAARIQRAFAVRPEPKVPCHNDLLAENFLDDGEQIWIIDYEYSGNNESSFELGDIWSESTLPLEHLDALVEAYDGTSTKRRIARARLWGLMSKYGWTLWASIMDAVSEVDFDFWGWGMEKYDRALAEFDGPDFERLLDEVTRD